MFFEIRTWFTFAFFAIGTSMAAAAPFKVGGTGGSLGYLDVMIEEVCEATNLEVIRGLGTSGANRATMAGALDVSISGRPLNDTERNAGLVSEPLLLTPFGFFTSTDTPPDVPVDEIWRLYLNPGAPNPVFYGFRSRIILRTAVDSELNFALENVEGFAEVYNKALDVPGVPEAITGQQSADWAESTANSVAIGTLLQMLSEKRDLRAITIDGVMPSIAAFQAGEYPFAKTFYFVFKAGNESHVQQFKDCLFSDRAREVSSYIGALVME